MNTFRLFRSTQSRRFGATSFVAAWAVSAPWLFVIAQDAAQPSKAKGKQAAESREHDDELLKKLDEGIDSDLLEGLDEAPARDGRQPEAGGEAPSDALDERLREALGGDESATEKQDPLVRAGQRMREAQQRIAKSQADRPTQELQEQAVAALDELIEQAKKKKGKKSSGSQNQRQSRRSQPKQPQNQKQQQQQGGQGSGTSPQPARDSTDELRPDRVEQIDAAAAQELMKDLWGHLPARVKEQMLQSSIEEFLPKYQALIEEYFKRLIDEQSRTGR